MAASAIETAAFRTAKRGKDLFLSDHDAEIPQPEQA